MPHPQTIYKCISNVISNDAVKINLSEFNTGPDILVQFAVRLDSKLACLSKTNKLGKLQNIGRASLHLLCPSSKNLKINRSTCVKQAVAIYIKSDQHVTYSKITSVKVESGKLKPYFSKIKTELIQNSQRDGKNNTEAKAKKTREKYIEILGLSLIHI